MKNNFAENLIKGKIGETIFEQMFREQGEYIVIPFGYEKIIPEISQYAKKKNYLDIVENVRTAPDFALVSHSKEEVFLIEVKYRTNINIEEIIEVAEKIKEKWSVVFIFICNPKGFYFDKTADIIKNKRLTPLKEELISKELQEKYLKLLKDFIRTERIKV